MRRTASVFISAIDQDDAKRAIATIKTIVEDPEIGAIYKGRVTRLMNFGAFVEIAPGKEGLVHISKLDDHRVEHVEDVVAVGDPIFGHGYGHRPAGSHQSVPQGRPGCHR